MLNLNCLICAFLSALLFESILLHISAYSKVNLMGAPELHIYLERQIVICALSVKLLSIHAPLAVFASISLSANTLGSQGRSDQTSSKLVFCLHSTSAIPATTARFSRLKVSFFPPTLLVKHRFH